jgi:hypothetical protein
MFFGREMFFAYGLKRGFRGKGAIVFGEVVYPGDFIQRIAAVFSCLIVESTVCTVTSYRDSQKGKLIIISVKNL